MNKVSVTMLVLAGAVSAAMAFGPTVLGRQPTKPATASRHPVDQFCISDEKTARNVLISSEQNGTIRSYEQGSIGVDLYVDERKWERAPYNEKVTIVSSAYCMSGPDKYARAVGYHDGAQKAFVTNGDYFD